MFDLESLIVQTKEMNLLYIEDNQETREATLMLFKNLFDNIIVAVDGEDGLDKFKNNKIDLVITDISMPKMNGLIMSKVMKQIDTNIPIIVLTAITNSTTIKESQNIKINSYLNKPLEDVDILFYELDRIIKQIRSNK